MIDYLRLSKLLIARKYFKINWILSVSSVASPETRGCNLNKHRLYRQFNYYGKVIYDLGIGLREKLKMTERVSSDSKKAYVLFLFILWISQAARIVNRK